MKQIFEILQEEKDRILSIYESAKKTPYLNVDREKNKSFDQEFILESKYNISLKKKAGWNSGALKGEYGLSKFKVQKSDKQSLQALITFDNNYSIDVQINCKTPDTMIIGGDGQFKGSEYKIESSKLINTVKWHCAGKPKKTESAGGGNKPKPNTDGWGKLNKTNGTYTLRSNQPLKASVDFTTKFPKNIPAGTVVFHDYKKNNNKIILGNTGVVTYCNRNTFIYNDGIDDLKNDGLMSTLKGIFCNGDR
jgi:hypothetical protein